jgi:hypothetical protein
MDAEIRTLLADKRFVHALSGLLLPDEASQSRIGVLLERLHLLASV